MSKCEACGGDGLIEVGAYRGDENDTDTRECRLCGGVAVVRYVPSVDEILDKVVQTRSETPYVIGIAKTEPSTAWYAGFHERAKQRGMTPQQIADEWTERLREENEREQREAESNLVLRGML